MPLTVTVFFDNSEHRQSYRARFRGAAYDKYLNVPRELFGAAGVDSRKESTKGRRIADRWAFEQAARIESGMQSVAEAPAFRERWTSRIADHDIDALLQLPSEKRESIAARLAAGAPENAPPEIRLDALVKLYVAKNPGQVGAKTLKRDRQMGANLVRVLGNPKPSTIDDERALHYRNTRGEEVDPRDGEPIRHRTIANELQFLKRLLTYGRAWWRETGIARMALPELPVIRRQKGYEVQLTNDELRVLFTSRFDHDTYRLQLIFQLALVSMLREDNITGARKEWWNLAERWRTIPEDFMKGKGGSKRELSVPISEWEAEIVAAAMKLSPKKSPYLFPNFNGRPSKWPIRTVKRIARECGIRYFSAHDERRTGMSVLEERGVSKVVIQWYVGHAPGGDVTDDYIARAAKLRTADRLREAVQKLDDFRAEIGLAEIPKTNRERARERLRTAA